MLIHLSIKNYALIDSLSIDFNKGFTVITGETGSGKSIMLGAIGLILGERADLKSLRDKSLKCVIEGVFSVSKTLKKTFFEKNDIDFEAETILRREITPSGKSRAFINDTPVKLNTIRELGEQLLDIHSQHQTQLLNKSDFQYQVLDAASNSIPLFNDYRTLLKKYNAVKTEIENLLALEQKANSERDYISFQLEELSKIDLELDKNAIEQEYNLLANAEDVIKVSTEAMSIINDENRGVVATLQQLEITLSKLEKVDEVYATLIERVKSASIEIQDVDFELNNKIASLEIDEERLIQLDELLGEINRLEKKYNVLELSELQALKLELENKQGSFDSIDEDLKKLKTEESKALNLVLKKGKELTKVRKKGLATLEKKVMHHLQGLAMPNAIFKVELKSLQNPSNFGLESIQFLIATNKGVDFGELNKVASGGELSRIMLSIKAILSENGELSTLVFDEIDTGVSGEVANKMGDMMKQMGTKMQIISITHLPQIASKGAAHINVYKKDEKEITNTYIQYLNKDERLLEIAKMLSGNNPTDAALSNAKELLN